MREQLLEYLKGSNLRGLSLSTDLPFVDGGTPLFAQRPKTLYVDIEQTETDPVLQTLSGVNISNEVTTLSVFFTVDAKRLIPGYNDLVDIIKQGKNKIESAGISRREATVATEFNNSTLLTQVDLTLTRIANE